MKKALLVLFAVLLGAQAKAAGVIESFYLQGAVTGTAGTVLAQVGSSMTYDSSDLCAASDGYMMAGPFGVAAAKYLSTNASTLMTAFSAANPASVGFYLYMTSTPSADTMMRWVVPANPIWDISVSSIATNPFGINFRAWLPGWTAITATGFNVGQCYYLKFTISGTTAKIFVDGSSTPAVSGTIAAQNASITGMYIGTDTGTGLTHGYMSYITFSDDDPSWTATITPSHTPTTTPTATPTRTPTWTPTATPTHTQTVTRTFTITRTNSQTRTPTFTSTYTRTPRKTATPTCVFSHSPTPRPRKTASGCCRGDLAPTPTPAPWEQQDPELDFDLKRPWEQRTYIMAQGLSDTKKPLAVLRAPLSFC